MSAGNREYRNRDGQLVTAMRITQANAEAVCTVSGGALTSRQVLNKDAPDDMSLARREFQFRGEPIFTGEWIVRAPDGAFSIVSHSNFSAQHIPVR